VPHLLVRGLLEQGRLVDLAAPAHAPVQLYWHCWNLDSQLLDQLTTALTGAAREALTPA
jgi:LysR family transcriptional regulator (chromosome initiation inhibitor)